MRNTPEGSRGGSRDHYIWGEALFLVCGSGLVLALLFMVSSEVTLRHDGDPMVSSVSSLLRRSYRPADR